MGVAEKVKLRSLNATNLAQVITPEPRVVLFDPTLAVFLETRTDAAGAYRIDALAGPYRAGASMRDFAYLEVAVALGATTVTQNFALPAETELGTWALIGDTSPEELAASNSGCSPTTSSG